MEHGIIDKLDRLLALYEKGDTLDRNERLEKLVLRRYVVQAMEHGMGGERKLNRCPRCGYCYVGNVNDHSRETYMEQEHDVHNA